MPASAAPGFFERELIRIGAGEHNHSEIQVTGIVEDQNGDKYYLVKNSWGTKHNELDGYFFASEAYAKLKTMNIYLHKDAIPKDIAKKLGL